MAKPSTTIPSIDLGYMRAATILTRQPEVDPITIMLVGCGGTGSYMALQIGRLLRSLKDKGTRARGVFIDHDHVEPKNIGRQLFCEAELGLNKAVTLAARYGTAWGLDVVARPLRFTSALVKNSTYSPHLGDGLLILVGCVDNAAARTELSRSLSGNIENTPGVWWLDCGNHEETGQVLLGSTTNRASLKKAFPSKEICRALPAPSLQRPELLVAKREEKSTSRLSCAELAAANLQSLNINNRIAAEAADMLTRLVLTRNLKRFACELNLAAGSVRSTYATPEAVAGVIK